MAQGDVILRFNEVSFRYGHTKPILNEAEFSVRRGSKVTLMGQNGAGKSTIFSLITKEFTADEGAVVLNDRLSIAIAKQTIPAEWLNLSVREYFEQAFPGQKIYDIDPRIIKTLKAVNMEVPLDRKVSTFSGGQKARLLLSFALIQNPDLLLLDEPTNNLDKAGIEYLKDFLKEYTKTVLVISHDADFLNSFSDGVLYLDVFTKKIEQYSGNYFTVVSEIEKRIERERMQNARLQRNIENRKEQMNFFSQKGGHLRDVASKMREKIGELEDDMIDMRQEDKTIRQFAIPCQENISGDLIKISSVSIIRHGKATKKEVDIALKKKERLLLKGPNGIGKTTLLETIAKGTDKHIEITEDVRVGYYRQDFSTLNPDDTVYKSLGDAMVQGGEQELRSTAAGFLLSKELMGNKIGTLSEGQKGLVALARLVLQKPGIIILDEPTNHINFRHLPVIAKALDRYEGAMILVSHMPEFVNQIKITTELDLEALLSKK